MTYQALADVVASKCIEGMILEFGVYRGQSIMQMAAVTDRKIYGFDWFKGLPEDWNYCHLQGMFACDIPEVPDNVELVVGLFQETLVPFLANHPGQIALAHMDADLYSSTSYVLQNIKSRLVPGSILAFDEIAEEPGSEAERRAFDELKADTGTKWELIGRRSSSSEYWRMLDV